MHTARLKFLSVGLVVLLLASGTPGKMVFAADCDNAMSQLEINQCESKLAEQADKNLNAVYKKLIAAVDGSGAGKLRAAERAWMAYRDSQCEFNERSSIGGSIHDAAVSACYQDFASKRTKELQAQLDCEENRGPCN